MGYQRSTLASLESLRRRGQRPDMPVVIADNPMSVSWGVRNGFCVVDRRDIADDFTAFAGLDAYVITIKPFGEVVEFAKQLNETARYVTIVDALHRRRSEYLEAA
jgi:hypothetical protein